jgi:hypothetical protein
VQGNGNACHVDLLTKTPFLSTLPGADMLYQSRFPLFETPLLTTTATNMESTTTKLRFDGTTDELPLVLHDRFSWIIAGNQVGVSWREFQHNTETDGDDDHNDHNHKYHQQHLGESFTG